MARDLLMLPASSEYSRTEHSVQISEATSILSQAVHRQVNGGRRAKASSLPAQDFQLHGNESAGRLIHQLEFGDASSSEEAPWSTKQAIFAVMGGFSMITHIVIKLGI